MDVSATDSVAQAANTMAKQTFGAEVVTETLNVMNQDQNNAGTNSDFDFQTKVLGAAYSGSGTMIDMMV